MFADWFLGAGEPLRHARHFDDDEHEHEWHYGHKEQLGGAHDHEALDLERERHTNS